MGSVTIAIVVASNIAIVLLILYAVANLQERGRNPHWSAEVYLYYDPAVPELDVAKTAAAHDAEVATARQVEVYLAAGGGAHGYGYVDGGAAGLTVVGAVPRVVGPGGLTAAAWPGTSQPSPVGIWLYGAKPRRGTHGVVPFNCVHWFQPA